MSHEKGIGNIHAGAEGWPDALVNETVLDFLWGAEPAPSVGAGEHALQAPPAADAPAEELTAALARYSTWLNAWAKEA